MVHNAASFANGTVADDNADDREDSLKPSLKTSFALAKELIPQVRKLGRGRLLYTSSVTGMGRKA